MSNTLLVYNESQDILNRDSEVLPEKEELEEGEEKEDLIYDNSYGDDDDDEYNNSNNIRSSNSSLCIIDECSALGANLIAITDSENYFPYFVCDKHYHELMIGYYFKETKERKKKNNNNAMIINNQI